MVMKRILLCYVMMALGLLPIGLGLAFGPRSLWLLPLILAAERGFYLELRRTFRRRAKKKKGHRPVPDGLSRKEISAVSIVTQGRQKVKVLCYE